MSSEEKLLKDKQRTLLAYREFWNNVAYQKGWAKPSFTFDEAEPFLSKAADYVARIRARLDAKCPADKEKIKRRHTIGGGSAREYLWSVEQSPNPLSKPGAFIRGLVHATFCDASGYAEEGLTEKILDDFMLEIDEEMLSTIERERKQSQLMKDILTTWNETQTSLEKFLGEWQDKSSSSTPYSSENEVEKEHSETKSVLMERVLEALQRLQCATRALEEEQERTTEDKMEEELSAEPPSSIADESAPVDEVESQTEVPEKKEGVPKEKEASAPMEEEDVGSAKDSTASQEAEEPCKETQEEKKEPPQKPSNTEILKVEKVAQDVNKIGGEVRSLQDNTEQLSSELMNDPEKAAQHLDDLQKKCLKYTNDLMNDLLALDSVVGTQEIRPKRKAQVQNIQHMLEDVESIKAKLQTLQEQVKREVEQVKQQKAKEQEQKKSPEPRKKKVEESPKPEPMEVERAQHPKHIVPGKMKLSEYWAKLRLNPKFDTDEDFRGYYISTFVPGMKKEDIRITVDKNGSVLTMEGLRLPTKEEESTMRKQLELRLPGELKDTLQEEQKTYLLLRMGAGRFGKFSATYQLPSNITGEIIPTYESGLLRVEIPKKQSEEEEGGSQAEQEEDRRQTTDPFEELFGATVPDLFSGRDPFRSRMFW